MALATCPSTTTILVHILPASDSTTLTLPIDEETGEFTLPIDSTSLTLPLSAIDGTNGTLTFPFEATTLETQMLTNVETGKRKVKKRGKSKKSKLTCHVCQKEFTRNSNLLRHRRKSHGEEKHLRNRVQPTPYQCTECKLYYTTKSTLKIHMQSQHSTDLSIFHERNSRMNCLECNESFKMAKELRKHYAEVHSLNLEVDHLQFLSFDDFLTWKKEMEVETASSFVRYSGDRRSKSGEVLYLMFRCRRSGHHISRGNGLRRLKRNGSIRINGHCPARIQASRCDDGSVRVSFTKTHLGHTYDANNISVEEHRELEDAKSKFLKEITRMTIRCESEEELNTLKKMFENAGPTLAAIRRKKRRAQLRSQYGSMPKLKKNICNVIN